MSAISSFFQNATWENWIALISTFVSLVVLIFTFVAHGSHGFEYGSFHGGLWKWCDDGDDGNGEHGCHSYNSHQTDIFFNDTSAFIHKVDAARGLFIFDHFLCLGQFLCFIGSLVLASSLVMKLNVALSFVNTVFLMMACSVATSAYQNYNNYNDFSLGASIIVPWVGFSLSLLLIPAAASLLLFTNGGLIFVSVNSESTKRFGGFF